jgi:hypothetical protein
MPFFSVRQSWDGSILSILRVQWTPDIFAGTQPTEEVIRLTVAGGTGLVNDVFALWAPRDTAPYHTCLGLRHDCHLRGVGEEAKNE